MIPVVVDYATPSVFESQRERALLGMSANGRRPVRFHGRIKEGAFLIRLALRTLGQVVWSDDTWFSTGNILDPIITVHPDRLFFEAFSQDQSVYALVIIDPTLFETEGEVRTGTTNIDFTAWLWASLAELRSSRQTWLRIEAAGFEVKTVAAGGRFEKKVELPLPWVRGFLNLQGAMAMPGTRITARPVDILAALRYLRYTKAKVSPRALRYEFHPDSDARIVLEPWEHVIPLKGTEHHYTEPRTIRTWGRRRLRLLESLLPFAHRVDVYLKGRALPSFYAVKMQGITFVLGLSGWTEHAWTESGSFDLLSFHDEENATLLEEALEKLEQRFTMTIDELAASLGRERDVTSCLMVRLCRQGRAVYDVEKRAYRHRELFEEPVDEEALYPPDPRREKAHALIHQGKVHITGCRPRETRKIRKLKTPEGKITRKIVYRDWHVTGAVEQHDPVEVVVNDTGRIIYGACTCEFFKENLLNKGPCEHMLALFTVGEEQRQDFPTSFSPWEEDDKEHGE